MRYRNQKVGFVPVISAISELVFVCSYGLVLKKVVVGTLGR